MEIDGDSQEKKTTRKQIFDFLSTVKDEKLKEQFTSDEKSFKSLDTVLKDYFESKECIDIDCEKEELKLAFDIFKDTESWSMDKYRKIQGGNHGTITSKLIQKYIKTGGCFLLIALPHWQKILLRQAIAG